jgi:Cu/Ag efflux pump CusA
MNSAATRCCFYRACACKQAARPIGGRKLMTALLAMIGLVPAALSTGIGSDTQKPIAIVIIGGLLIETILTLYSLPIRYKLFCRAPVAAASEEAEELLVPEPA